MKIWRWIVILALYVLPVAVFFTVGVVAVWRSRECWWLWWLAPLCWVVAYGLTRAWRKQLSPPSDSGRLDEPLHWTTRDREAWRLVELRQQQVAQISPTQLTDPHFYLQSAMDLASEISRHYQPTAKNPVGSLTVLDLLAAAQLAIEDSAVFCQQYVPASHLLTVDQWRLLGKSPEWFPIVSNIAWLVSVLANPANIGRYLIARYTTGNVTKELREHLLGWFYMIFVRNAGFYLVEMNSGRLRGGAARYRQLQARLQQATAATPASEVGVALAEPSPLAEPVEVQIALVGQVKAGKSSLINALLGQQQAAVDVLPLTKHVQRYELRRAELGDRLVLLDTGGYADDGATSVQMQEMYEALREADLVLLIMNATNPSRRADVRVLGELNAWFQANRHRKQPVVIGVATHIDQLSPALEWAPPYDWNEPSRAKEQSIAGAVAYTREQFGSQLTHAVPVCADVARGRAYGTYEWLLPVMLGSLNEARACTLLRSLHAELDRGRVQQIFRQLGNACTGLIRSYLAHLQGKP